MFFLYIQYYMHFYEIWCFLKSRYIWNRKKSGDIPCIYVKRYLLYLCIYLFGMIWSVWGWRLYLIAASIWCAIRCDGMKSSAVGWWLGRYHWWRLVKGGEGKRQAGGGQQCQGVLLGFTWVVGVLSELRWFRCYKKIIIIWLWCYSEKIDECYRCGGWDEMSWRVSTWRVMSYWGSLGCCPWWWSGRMWFRER